MPQTGEGRDRERILGTRRNKQTKEKSSHTEKRKDSVREIYSEGNLSFLIECTLKKQNKLKLDKYSTKRSVVFPLTKKLKEKSKIFYLLTNRIKTSTVVYLFFFKALIHTTI